MNPFWSIALEAAILIAAYVHLVFLLGIRAKRNDVADVAWGMGYFLLVIYCTITRPLSPSSALVFGLIGVWALRLSAHIYLRNRKKKEDFRYRQWREAWGHAAAWRAYGQVYLLQGFILLLMSSPILLAAIAPSRDLHWTAFIGLAIGACGLIIQALADHQLSQFKAQSTDTSAVLQSGLWRYSRHPNYFGEILIWCGISIICLPMPWGYLGLLSPVLITYLLCFVSGIPLLENRYRNNEAYQRYRQKTSALIFWPPQKQ